MQKTATEGQKLSPNISTAKEKVKGFIKRHNRLFSAVAVGVAAFFLLMAFWWQPWFVSDEAEIFMHGQAIAQGELLYADTGSQHMPLMYYIAAFFSLIGVRTITGFRIAFYVLTAVIWALMYHRYKDRWGGTALCLYPVLYMCVISHLDWTATCVLSDQYQAIGMVILFFEFMEFNETRYLKISNCCMVSLAIFISFGSAFVAAFAIFVMACAFFALDIWGRIKKKTGVREEVSGFFKQFAKLALIVAVPFAVLLLYYAVTGTLDDFINWAYVLNRTVYVNYTGGYGSNILMGFFGGALHFYGLITFSALSAKQLLTLLLLLFSTGWMIYLAKRGNGAVIRIVGLLLFLIACATRGLADFHGLPAMAVLCAMSACFLGRFFSWASVKKNMIRLTAFAFAIVFVATPYAKNLVPAWAMIWTANDMPENSTAWCLDEITERGERVGFGLLNCDVMVLAGVRPATVQGGSVPWFWDYAGEETMQELKSDPPRAYLCSLEHEVWGYKIVDYAPELISFLLENYTSLDELGQPNLWVRNDYAAEAKQIILTARGK